MGGFADSAIIQHYDQADDLLRTSPDEAPLKRLGVQQQCHHLWVFCIFWICLSVHFQLYKLFSQTLHFHFKRGKYVCLLPLGVVNKESISNGSQSISNLCDLQTAQIIALRGCSAQSHFQEVITLTPKNDVTDETVNQFGRKYTRLNWFRVYVPPKKLHSNKKHIIQCRIHFKRGSGVAF